MTASNNSRQTSVDVSNRIAEWPVKYQNRVAVSENETLHVGRKDLISLGKAKFLRGVMASNRIRWVRTCRVR